ncbi:MAG: AraC family transcriptional regulator [Bacteroidales bacterium]|jgi:AraC-like DNA-binding protein|nr:AraC family transcriptional regulator [Bacteroidales bacterium]
MNKKENLNLILLNIGRAVHNADWNWKGVNSPFARIYFVESGSAKVIIGDKLLAVTPGFLYLIPSFTTHGYVCDGPFVLYYIHVYDEQHIFDRLNFPFKVEAGKLEALLVKRLLAINPDRELTRYDPGTYDNPPTLMQNIAHSSQFPFYTIVETKGILLQLFSHFLVRATFKQNITDKRILKVVRYIREHIHQAIKIQELSALCCLSDDHFIRIFKKELKCTPMEYINQRKIERTQLMLLIDEKPVKEIAYSLSFENVSYFNRLFKKYTQLTPNQYREKLIQGKNRMLL